MYMFLLLIMYISSQDDVALPDGWAWMSKWQMDLERPGDAEGFEYALVLYSTPLSILFISLTEHRHIALRTLAERPI